MSEKYNEAALGGWDVLRVTSTHIKSGEAVEWVRRAVCGERGTHAKSNH